MFDRFVNAKVLDMASILEAEQEALKLRLLAIVAVLAGLYAQQHEILRDSDRLPFVAGLAVAYLLYTLSLRSLILPRIRTRYVVYGMIMIDVAVLTVAMHLAGGLQTNVFILFPLIVIFYAIHLDYVSSFFAAAVISFTMATYTFATNPEGSGFGSIVALQAPLFFMLAYFGGFLARRTTHEREKREALEELIHIESGTKGLREVVRVINRTLELYEDWVDSHVSQTPEKEAMEKLRFSLNLDAQYALAHLAFGKTYAETGQLGRAAEAYHRALALDPRLSEAYRGLSEALLRQGRFQEALDPAMKYAEVASQDWVAHKNLAVIYTELNMSKECRDAEEMALAVSTGEDREALAAFFERLPAQESLA